MVLSLEILFVVVFIFSNCKAKIADESEGIAFLDYYETIAADYYQRRLLGVWNYETNLTDYNLDAMTAANLEFAKFSKEAARNASRFAWETFKNETIKRLFKKITNIGFAASNDTEKLKQKSDLMAELTNIYSTGTVCSIPGIEECQQLEPGLSHILANSANEEQLRAVWIGFRDATGKQMKTKYEQLVNILNDAIKFSGYKDTGEYWRARYEVPDFETDIRNLYDEVSEFYQHLHYYVKQKLKNVYKADVFPETGHIPAHILGNMWAQEWNNIYDKVLPYPNASSVDITQAMIDKGFNSTYMFKVAEDFFKSMGFQPLPETFWTRSMLEKPTDRDVICHGSSWDFYDKQDYRITQCASVTQDHLMTAHHEIGHLFYDTTYKDLPIRFREGANPGFHEGVAEIATISFQTPEHLAQIGMIDSIPDDKEADINFLLRMALEKVAFLPYAYVMDLWRWSVFKGETTPQKYNQKWWELRCEIQGIAPPVDRNEEDFDPGAKYHIPGNVAYVRYFVSRVLQFMWHKSLCEEAGHTGPLHRCDIYNSRAAGDKLKEMLRLGSSKHWKEALYTLTGSRTMSFGPLIEYFQPLLDWLKKQNGNADVSWNKVCPHHMKSASTTAVAHKVSIIFTLISVIMFLL